ncbi:MAG: aminoacyl-tRNA hydrolase [Deltaproteobacteria bacterium]|nr:aminoacyl-tRNA hydrolase [Deltaproteobacteria bacterium]
MSDQDLRVTERVTISAHELRQEASRSGGPGGQHTNKTSTRVTLRWNALLSRSLDDPSRQILITALSAKLTRSGDVVVHVDDYRSRKRNLDLARERLAKIIADGLKVARSRRPTRPSRAARERRMNAKRQRSSRKRERNLKGNSFD